MSRSIEREIDVVLMRGGTSKGVFIRAADLPPAGPRRDDFVLALMGSPDPMQLDGLGGTHSSTSKLMAISPSTREDTDVDYLFAQVGVDRPIVDYAGNCGNLTAAVGAYAVDEWLVSVTEPVTTVRLFNSNTGRRVLVHVPVRGGRSRSDGPLAIAGVPGTGAPVVTEYLDPAGAVTGALLPTGVAMQTIRPDVGGPVEVSIVDVGGPAVFVRSADLHLAADTAPSKINADDGLLARLESIRAACAVLVGFAPNERDALVSSMALPRLMLVHAPTTHWLADGTTLDRDGHDLVVRVMSAQRAHHACPLTVGLCAAAAAQTPGTIAHENIGNDLADLAQTVRLAHPKGIAEVDVSIERGDYGGPRSVSVVRTARRLLTGTAHVRCAQPSPVSSSNPA